MKIAIVGTSNSAKFAPFKSDWEIWSIGRNHAWIPHYDKWFELHTFDHLVRSKTQKIYFDHLVTCGNKLHLIEPNPKCPDAQIFPKAHYINKYGKYFTSSIAWMIIHAIEQNPTDIGIWGVDMKGDGEYAHQRPCCEFWLGRALEKGINLNIHPSSTLLTGPTYCDDSYYEILRMAKDAKDAADKARDDAYYRVGYSDALNHIGRTFG